MPGLGPRIWPLLALAATRATAAGASADAPAPPPPSPRYCGEVTAPSPPALRAALEVVGQAAQQPCIVLEGIGVPEQWNPDYARTGDDHDVQMYGLGILGLTFACCGGLGLYGLWTSLKPGARHCEPEVASLGAQRLGQPSFQDAQQSFVSQVSRASAASGTPSRRLLEERQFEDPRTPITGSSRNLSWSSAISTQEAQPITRQMSETPRASVNTSLWVYAPPARRPLALRSSPTLALEAKTRTEFGPGSCFWVVDTFTSDFGTTFLKVADGVGWAFDCHPDHGILCRPAELISISFLPPQDRAGFKINFARGGGGEVTSVTSQLAREAGLRDGDCIVKVNGQWVREKHVARAAVQGAVGHARSCGEPMSLEVYRADGQEDEDDGQEVVDEGLVIAAHNAVSHAGSGPLSASGSSAGAQVERLARG